MRQKERGREGDGEKRRRGGRKGWIEEEREEEKEGGRDRWREGEEKKDR